jgi:type VI secretion system secreted protein VgrG
VNDPEEAAAAAMTVEVFEVAGQFHVHRVQGHEGLGCLFEYQVELSNQNEPDWLREVLEPEARIKPQDLLGKKVTVSLPVQGGKTRYLSGMVSKAAYTDSFDKHTSYRVTLHPELWLLTLNRNCRIFSNQPAIEVVKEILAENRISAFRESLLGGYRIWDYLTQYHESDFEFISRVLAQEGLYYYFEHNQKGHTMVLADPVIAHQGSQDFDSVQMGRPKEIAGSEEYLSRWRRSLEVETEAVTLGDFDFRLARDSAGVGGHSHISDAGDARHEVYGFPAKCTLTENQERPVATQGRQEAARLAEIHLEGRRCQVERYQGQGTVRWLAPGMVFSVVGAENDANQKFLSTASEITWRNTALRSGGGPVEEPCEISLCAVDSRVAYRMPPRKKPVMMGPQTAWVVGAEGDEICTDKYGRIKVQFHWDREGKFNQDSSCWLRVAQPWAGNHWGAIHIPRVGNEVVVVFLDGDPDRPLVTGSVYNADNMPPYDLPEHKTQSGIKTHSSKNGAPGNFNEIRFEDKKNHEELHFQAERNMSTVVKHDQTLNVHADRAVTVDGNESITVKGTREQTVIQNETQTFLANRRMTVALSNWEQVTGLHSGEYLGGRNEIVENGDSLTVSASDKTVFVEGDYKTDATKEYSVQAGQDSKICSVDFKDGVAQFLATEEIRLVCGQASLTLKKDGTVEIKGAKQVSADGAGSKLGLASAGASLKGATASIAGTSSTTITGNTVKIN